MARTIMSISPAVASLQNGEFVSDRELDDALFPPVYGGPMSRVHWTPMEVSLCAASLLADGGGRRILDIGAGVGKFCIVGALTTPAIFVGVEQRAHLVETARAAAERAGASRASFVHANVIDIDFTEFDSFYLYNPFCEQISPNGICIDETIEPSHRRYQVYVAATIRKLQDLRQGTRVVTYNGFGGDMPLEYEQVPVQTQFWCDLAFWVRR